MAEGGYDDPTKPDITKGDEFDPNSNDDDAVLKAQREKAVQELNATGPFDPDPGQASTPYGLEMKTMQQEQTGPLPCYAENSLGGGVELFVHAQTGIIDVLEIPDPKDIFLSEKDRNQRIEQAKIVTHNFMKKIW